MKGVATALRVLFFVLAGIYVINVVLLLQERQSWKAFDRGDESILDVQDARDAVGAVGAFTILVGIAVGVLIIIWAHRSRKNLDAFGVNDPPLSPGMAIGLWFIPLASVVLGYILLNGVWKGSDPDDLSPAWRERSSSVSFNLWWWLWTVGGLFMFFGGFYLNEEAGRIDSVAEGLRRNSASLTGAALLAGACVFAAIAVGQFAKRQHTKAARLAPSNPGYGGASSARPPSWG